MKIVKWTRGLVVSLAMLTGVAGVQSASAATMIATQEALSADLGKVEDFLDREDVTRALENLGVDKDEAERRVAALSPEELRNVAQHIDDMPAAGDIVIGTGAIILILILWLIFR